MHWMTPETDSAQQPSAASDLIQRIKRHTQPSGVRNKPARHTLNLSRRADLSGAENKGRPFQLRMTFKIPQSGKMASPGDSEPRYRRERAVS